MIDGMTAADFTASICTLAGTGSLHTSEGLSSSRELGVSRNTQVSASPPLSMPGAAIAQRALLLPDGVVRVTGARSAVTAEVGERSSRA